MPTPPPGAVIDEATKTVTIRQAAYTFEAATCLPGYHHVIYASTLRVRGTVRNPGCHLTIFAAQLVVEGAGAELDMTGAPGKGFQPGERGDALDRNGYDGRPGDAGAPGEPGKPGGTIRLYVGSLRGGKLVCRSQGGVGGRGQDGGNGYNGAQPQERHKPDVPRPVVVGYDWVDTNHGSRQVPRYGWPDSVREIGVDKAIKRYNLCVTLNAESGLPGGRGGHAGLAGRSGNGGSGGQVLVQTLRPVEASLTAEVGGGDGGPLASHGTPGKGAAGGLGAKLLYHVAVLGKEIDWSNPEENGDWDEHFNTKNSKFLFFSVDPFDDLRVADEYIVRDGKYKKLRSRANAGPAGHNGGYGPTGAAQPPALVPTERGSAGTFRSGPFGLTRDELQALPLAYLQMLQRSATTAELNRQAEDATLYWKWLQALTAPFRTPVAEPARQQFYVQAEAALLALARDPDARPARCAYTDILRYADFVTQSLEHVRNQEKYFAKFTERQATLAEQRSALQEAIGDARKHLTHLTGSPTTPGSILYLRQKEKQLREAIGQLDVKLLGFRESLAFMPTALQREIDRKTREKNQIGLWDALEFLGMAAGVVVSFAGAAGAISSMATKVKAFYKEEQNLTNWGAIFKNGIWDRDLADIKGDLEALTGTDEWKKLNEATKKLVSGATDFQAKAMAYYDMETAWGKREQIDYQFAPVDAQATILLFDTGKLDLKLQRNAFEHFLEQLLDAHDTVSEFKYLFADYFDTADTRFDLLAHLADVKAERRELEFQRERYEQNLELLTAELGKVDFAAAPYAADDLRTSLEANLHLALGQSLNRIFDERRAFRIWTLEDFPFPPVPDNLTAQLLETQFHRDLWSRIQTLASSSTDPAHRDFSAAPLIWRRAAYPQLFAELARTGRVLLSVPVDRDANIYFQRLIDVRILLRGARTAAGSPVYGVLRHSGVSEFLTQDRSVRTCFQPPRAIEFSYLLEGTGEQARPNYDHPGAIKQPFDHPGDPGRIRYSPFTTWELELPANYKPDRQSTAFNQDLDLSQVDAIELYFSTYFKSFHVRRAKPSPADAGQAAEITS